ncbi:ABC transporter substrate-binding protein [Epibacterium ulvae]|uniref:ABC transporter substrate-binding protein n=1 Tax=Epibacterium ulvae TaxID=1156985 RepID=UPI00248F8439|nr:ABC transporter substrate-binding protein [Epibacterium ulvae]
MKTKYSLMASAALSALVGTSAFAPAVQADDATFKIGVVTFLSGGASGPFGIPGRNAAEVVIEAINAGTMPAPYDTAGIGGAMIEQVVIDENSKQKVADYQKLVDKDEVDAVVGYASSGSCKAIAPEAEKLKQLTVFAICGTPQIFEEIVTEPEYLFRSMSHATMDNVGAARYVLDTTPELKTIGGINQNYAWGQDSWRDFSETIAALKSSVEVDSEQFPKIFAGQYGSEISALLSAKVDVVHSSFWGGDLEAMIIQGAGRGLFDRSQMVLTSSDTAIPRLGAQIPNGTIIGARGFNGPYAPDTELANWFEQAYFDRFGVAPVSPSYQMAQSIMALKAAADKAQSSDPDAIRAALAGLTFESASGEVSMSLSDGHQAATGIAYGTYEFDASTGKGSVKNVRSYAAGCVNPPVGVTSGDWIKGGFDGATCE